MDSDKIDALKEEARLYYSAIRDNLGVDRRLEGSLACSHFFKEKLKHFGFVCSFASRGNEINVWDLNLALCSWGKLVLPRLVDNHLSLYRVTDIESQLVRSKLNILEPNPKLCQKVEIDTLDVIIVPGLSFDHHNHRLGYGRGHYDRLLAPLDEKLTIGVCFKEQMAQQLPTLDHDTPVNKIFTF